MTKSKHRISLSDASERTLADLLQAQPLATAHNIIRRATALGLETLKGTPPVPELDLTKLGPWATQERVERLLAQAPGVFDALARALNPEWFETRR